MKANARLELNESIIELNPALSELAVQNRWVCHLNKAPYGPAGITIDIRNDELLMSFNDAECVCRAAKLDGLGYVLKEGGNCFCIDIDKCVEAASSEISSAAKEIILAMHSYTEFSPSGTGVHIWGKGDISSLNRTRFDISGLKIEVYHRLRYITVTGNHVRGTPPTQEHCANRLLELVHGADGSSERKRPRDEMCPTVIVSGDDEIINCLRSRSASLLEGNWRGKYPSQSEAVYTFVGRILKYTSNMDQIDRIFKRSGLYSERWTAKWPRLSSKMVADLLNKREYAATEFGNADRFISQNATNIRYVPERKKWFIWDQSRWLPTQTQHLSLAMQSIRTLETEAALCKHEKRRKFLARFAKRSQQKSMVYSVLDLARAEQQLVLPLETFDDPERCKYLLNCPNGTLNLKSGELKAAERTDYISKVCATAYDPTAKCPQWEAFLIQTFGGNQELIDFARRSLGYTLTGSTAERCIFILYGKGANGKSTFLETFRSVLGPDFAVRATTSLFVQTRFEPSVTNDLARLKGARYVIVSESESGSRIKTSLIKDITSVEKITARFLREENFEFTSEAKVFWGTNHKPSLSADDQAIWDRLVLIPFTNTVPPAKRDKDLIERLKAEAQGILAWAVRGAVEYFEFGLNKPREVVDATSAYREELDSVSHFLNAWCKVAQEPKTTLDAEFDIQPPVDPHSSLEFAAGELFLYYEKFCEVEGYKPHRIKDFKAALEARGFQQGPRKRGGKFWQGIIVLPIIKEEYAQRLPR